MPQLGPGDQNDFLTKLFDKAKKSIEEENQVFAPLKEQYDAAMAQVFDILATITDIETANAAAAKIPTLEHALTSKKEASTMLKAKTAELGLVWSRELNSFKAMEAK